MQLSRISLVLLSSACTPSMLTLSMQQHSITAGSSTAENTSKGLRFVCRYYPLFLLDPEPDLCVIEHLPGIYFPVIKMDLPKSSDEGFFHGHGSARESWTTVSVMHISLPVSIQTVCQQGCRLFSNFPQQFSRTHCEAGNSLS
jgi:hypothetical protein